MKKEKEENQRKIFQLQTELDKKVKKIQELENKRNSFEVIEMQEEYTKSKKKIKALELSARTDKCEIKAYKYKVGIVEITDQEKFDETNLRLEKDMERCMDES